MQAPDGKMRETDVGDAEQLLCLIQSEWMFYRFIYAGKYKSNIKVFKFWKDGNHPMVLDNNYMMNQKLEYIQMNPAKARIVNEPHYYIHSSAIDYSGREMTK